MAQDTPLTVYKQATDALELTLRLTPDEIDPGVLEVRARAIATPVVIAELRRLAGQLLDAHADSADDLNAREGQLAPAEHKARHSVNEAVRAIASKLAARAEALDRESGD